MAFNDQLYVALHNNPDKPMMDYKGRILSAGELAQFGDSMF
jgi:hypothetical protein